MKKTLIALAALAATGAAFAQSSVTLYGRLDVGYANNVTDEVVGTATSQTKAIGGTGDGLATSYWGIKGSEDLGGGLKANFNLESAVAVATGASSGFTRISTVGLSGDSWGSLNIGRYYTPFFLNQKGGDVNDAAGITTWHLTSYNVTGGTASAVATVLDAIAGSPDVRGNGFHYASPNFSGFNVRVMVAPSDSTRNDSGVAVTSTSNMSNNGLSASYANGPLFVGVAWGEQTSKTSGSATEGKGTGQGVAASYDFGAAKVFANWGKTKRQTNTSVETYDEKSETNLGVAAPFGKTTVSVAWGRNSASSTTAGAESASFSGNDWILGAQYDLSKRTALYVKTGVYNKYDGQVSGAARETKTTNTAFGVRHLF